MSLCYTEKGRRYTPQNVNVVCFDLDGLLIDLLDHTLDEFTTLSIEVNALTDREGGGRFILNRALTCFDFFDQGVDGSFVSAADSLKSRCVNH